MTPLIIVAILAALTICALGLLLRESLRGLQDAREGAQNERAQERENMARERAQWIEERSILLTRLQDPPAGIAQAWATIAPPVDPAEQATGERW